MTTPEPDFYIKQNDTRPALRVTLKDAAGMVVDLTGATVKFTLKKASTIKVTEAATTIVNATGGIVEYDWATTSGSTDTAGLWHGEFEVTFPGGKIETFPNGAHLRILITSELA